MSHDATLTDGVLARLAELARRLRDLERRVEALERQMDAAK